MANVEAIEVEEHDVKLLIEKQSSEDTQTFDVFVTCSPSKGNGTTGVIHNVVKPDEKDNNAEIGGKMWFIDIHKTFNFSVLNQIYYFI